LLREEQRVLASFSVVCVSPVSPPLAQASDILGEGDQDSGTQKLPEVSRATSSAYAGGEGILSSATTSIAINSPGSADGGAPGTAGSLTVAGATSDSAATFAIAGSSANSGSGALGIAATKSQESGQVSIALAGAVTKDPGGSSSSKIVAAAGNVSSEGIKLALVGTSSVGTSIGEGTSMSADSSVSMVLAGTMTSKGPTAEKAEEAVLAPLVSTLQSEGYMCERDGSQKVSQSAESKKAKRERREKKNKHSSRKSSRHHRTGESHRRTGESHHRTSKDKNRKSSSHRSTSGHGSTREDKKEKGHGSSRSRRHGSSHKSSSRSSTTKESRKAQRARKSRSAGGSGTVSKKSSKISSFLKSLIAMPSSKTVTSHNHEIDIMSKKVEKHNIETKVEKVQDCQELEISGTLTSELTERIIFEAKPFK
jgi:hypothetical protein